MKSEQHLLQLEMSGLVQLAATDPELEYLFRHAMFQEVAYDSLLRQDRRRLHQAVGLALEQLYPERQTELAALLAHHFSEAGDLARALRYFSLAGDRALAVYANREAEHHYRAALKLAETETDRARLLAGMGQALALQSCYEEALQTWNAAIALYQALGDIDCLARLYARSARYAWWSGDSPRSLALCEQGLAALGDRAETPGVAELLHEAARTCYFKGQRDQARTLCAQALDLAGRLGCLDVQADALVTLGVLQISDQRLEEALATLRRAVEIADSAGLFLVASRAYYNIASTFEDDFGELPAARYYYQRSAEEIRKRHSAAEELFVLNKVADISLLLGDFKAADTTLQRLRQLIRTASNPGVGGLGLELTEALLLRYQGQLEAAVQRLRAYRNAVRERTDLQNLINANFYLAGVLMELGLWDEAETALVEAIELNDQPNWSDNLWSRCLLSTVRAYQGRMEEAHNLLEQARAKSRSRLSLIDQRYLTLAQARLAMVEQRWSEAIALFGITARIEAQVGMQWYRARRLQEWAEAYLARGEQGDDVQARELLHEALITFEELNISYYATRIRQRLESLAPQPEL